MPLTLKKQKDRFSCTYFRKKCIASCTFFLLLFSMNVSASKVKEFRIDSKQEMAKGTFKNTRLFADGSVGLAQRVQTWSSKHSASLLTLAVLGKQEILFAGSSGGEIYSQKFDAKLKRLAKSEVLIKLKSSMITKLLSTGSKKIIAFTAPKAQIQMITLAENQTRVQRVHKKAVLYLKNIDFILDAVLFKGDLYAVGGGREGVFIKVENPFSKDRRVKILAKVAEKSLRSLAVNSNGLFFLGSGEKGRVYKFHESRLSVIYESKGNEVSDLLVDSKNRVFASIIDVNGNIRSKLNDEKNADIKKETIKTKFKSRKVKGAILVRIDPDANFEILWHSKHHAIYALSFKDLRKKTAVILATGPKGRLYEVGTESGDGWSILQEIKQGRELLDLLPFNGGLFIASAQFAALHFLTPEKAKEGFYISPIWDAKKLSNFGTISTNLPSGRWLRTGFTAKYNKYWSSYRRVMVDQTNQQIKPAQYVQARIQIRDTLRLKYVSLSYLQKNSAPVIQKIDILKRDWRLEAKDEYRMQQKTVQLSKNAFDKVLNSSTKNSTEEHSVQQTQVAGYQSFFVWAQDADQDPLLYKYWLKPNNGRWYMLKDWSINAFVGLNTQHYAKGIYYLKVQVSDRLENSHKNEKKDTYISQKFIIGPTLPIVENMKVGKTREGFRIRFSVESSDKISSVRCSKNLQHKVEIPPVDYILDSRTEKFDYLWPQTKLDVLPVFFNCMVEDKNGMQTKFELK